MNSYVKSISHRWEKVTSPSGRRRWVIKVKKKKKKVSGVGCQRRRVRSAEVAEGACYHTRGASTPPPLHLTSLCSPPRAKNANCQCEY